MCASGASIVEKPTELGAAADGNSTSLSSSMSAGYSVSMSSSWNSCGLPKTTLRCTSNV